MCPHGRKHAQHVFPWHALPALVGFGALLALGCGGPLRVTGADQVRTLRHAVFIRDDGRLAAPTDSNGNPFDFTTVVNEVPQTSTESVRQELMEQRSASEKEKGVPVVGTRAYTTNSLEFIFRELREGRSSNQKLLLWIHGGRNPLGQSPDRTLRIARALDDHGTGYYPICINWQSSDISGYWNHLTFARPAKRNAFEQALRFGVKLPLRFVNDVGRGVFRTPVSIYLDLAREWTAYTANRERVYELSDSLEYSRGGAPSGVGKHFKSLYALVTLPIRVIPILFTNIVAPGQWEGYRHSTQQMFHLDDPLASTDTIPTFDRDGHSGAMALFAQQLEDYARENPDVEITVMAHSMGAIIASEMLRHYPDLPITTIVFMAAACASHDFIDAVLPHLARNPEAKFYNVTLHRTNELQETMFPLGDFIYRGSLLTWIDDFISAGESPLDRTFGRDSNGLPVMGIVPDSLRSRIFMKAFGNGDALEQNRYPRGVPRKHSHFSNTDLHFWEQKFWTPDSLEN